MNKKKTVDQVRSATQDGIDKSSATSGEEWRAYAMGFIFEYCQTHSEVFVDDLWGAGLIEPYTPLSIGSAIRRARTNGWIKPLMLGDYYLTKISHAHGHTQQKQVWKSLIFQGE